MAQAGSENKEPWNEETRAKFEGYVLVSLSHGMTADCLRTERRRKDRMADREVGYVQKEPKRIP